MSEAWIATWITGVPKRAGRYVLRVQLKSGVVDTIPASVDAAGAARAWSDDDERELQRGHILGYIKVPAP